MVEAGEWRVQTGVRDTRGFHLSELYSPWVTWGETAVNFHKAKALPDKLKVWINTALAETWEEAGEKVDWGWLAGRKETYAGEVPSEVLVMTAGVDVQEDRLECSVYGWGLDEQGWTIDHRIFQGDPSASNVWDLLLDYLIRDFSQAGRDEPIKIFATFVDAGDQTEHVYRFCKAHIGRRIFPSRGSTVHGKPLVSRPSRIYQKGIKVYFIGTDTAKDLLFRRLQINDPGPGYIHFHAGLSDEFFAQLTSERLEKRYFRGYTRRYYVKVRNRNEALDCLVMAYAAMILINPDFKALLKRRTTPSMPPPDEPQDSVGQKYVVSPGQKTSKRPRGRGWMKQRYGGYG
jgi:phage terminase large subunit GpA-like protein